MLLSWSLAGWGRGRSGKLNENSKHRSPAATRWLSTRPVKMTLLACFALLGFASTYAYAGGLHGATAPTTVPNPDPPPVTTTIRPLPPPPPPPPPPTQTYAPPPPPPAAFTPPRVKEHRKRIVRQQSQPNRKKAVLPAGSTSGSPPPPEITQLQPASLGPAVVPVATLTSGSSSSLLPLLLGIALVLSLIVVGLAMTPPGALPRPVGIVVYEQRDSLVYGGLATALAIGLGLLITLGAS